MGLRVTNSLVTEFKVVLLGIGLLMKGTGKQLLAASRIFMGCFWGWLCLLRVLQGLNIPDMKRWRKYIVCLLLVTLPVSLWAGMSVPRDCASAQTEALTTEPALPESNDHAHHGMAIGMDSGSGAQPVAASTDSMKHNSSSTEPCCDTCITVCLASSLSAVTLTVASLEPAAFKTHLNRVVATRFQPGPSYPSLYRPPISQI